MALTKAEFKKRWDSDSTGGGITMDDIAECAKEWGLFPAPKVRPAYEVLEAVCKAAGVTP